jgi:protein involved in polysaccharide export with SLBB domain
MIKPCGAVVVIALTATSVSLQTLFAQDSSVPPASSQYDAGIYATREYLTALLMRYDDQSSVTAYSDVVRDIAKDEAEIIRTRLREGDFEVGDAITITVAGHSGLSNTFTVAPGRLLILPELGEPLRLTGLLRSELPDSLRAFIGRFIRNPQVYVQTSIRLQVFGEVGDPGFHDIAADLRFTDVLESVGQPSKAADLKKMKIKRDDEVIWDGGALQDAIVHGMTIDQLSLRAGDVIEVPELKQRNIGQVIRDLYFLVPITLFLSRIF